jgi:Uma2 family endonuclease
MSAGFVTAAEMQQQLGGIPLERIRMVPPPGTATDEDAMRVQDSEGRTCEVIDGILVEKAMGYFEARVATVLAFLLEGFLQEHDLGIAVGPDGLIRLTSKRSRAPDVAVFKWEKFPNRELPSVPVPQLVPDLAVEVLSKGNTRAEIEAKLEEYFTAGVTAIWVIDPGRAVAKLYESRSKFIEIRENGMLRAPTVLLSFEISLGDLLNRAGRRGQG